MRRLAGLCLLLGFFLSAAAQEKSIVELQRSLRSSKGDDYVRNLLDLCWQYRFRNADSARQYGMEALQLSRKQRHRDFEATALNYVGVTYEAQGDYQDALQYEMEALTIRRQLGDDSKIAQTLNDIGIIHDERGDYPNALSHYYEARRIFEKLGDRSKIAMVINNIGVVLKAQKEYRKVVGLYQEALTIYQSLGNKFGVAACEANLGAVYLLLDQYDSALSYSLKSEQGFLALQVAQYVPASVSNAGIAYDKLGRTPDAVRYLKRALELNQQYDNKKETAYTLIYLGRIALREGNLEESRRLVEEGLALAGKIHAQNERMEGLEMLSQIMSREGNPSAALRAYTSYVAVKDSLFEAEKARQIAELQTQYDTEKKESQIRFLQQDVSMNRQFIVGLILTLMGLVFIGYLWRNRVRLKQEVELETTRASLREAQLQAVIASQEEERKRFAADLHDGLGQMISAVRLSLSSEQPDPVAVRHALQSLNDMNGEIRQIAFNLMPQVLVKSGLTDALTEFAKRLTMTGKVKVDVQAFDVDPNLSAETKIALYRVCQEWVNNVIKYSGCTRINLQLVQHDYELVITIEDDGQGFDATVLQQGRGNGWRNIQSRLALVKGEFEIDSIPGRNGTTVVISAPASAPR
ncbi:MAG: sensor histidine kinase [Cyclobacteriaceae bacterium]|nr:sensor histidine kinase [Cyclobacteriaceae bacterium]